MQGFSLLSVLWRQGGHQVVFQLHSLRTFAASVAAQQPPGLPLLTAARQFSSEGGGRIFGACVFERLPVVVPEDPDWEVEYREWQAQLHSAYRKTYPPEFLAGERLDAGLDEGMSQWQPAPRVTEADHADDRRSPNRLLDKRLFLLVKCAGEGAEAAWRFPQAEHQPGETIRQTAERALESTTGDTVTGYTVGNSPMGHFSSPGGTVYYIKRQILGGEVKLLPSSRCYDYVWAARAQMPEYFSDPQHQELLHMMLSE